MTTFRIGSGAGYAGDRWEPALELVEHGSLHVLALECLAERTIALGHLERLKDPARGYNPYLEERWRVLLPAALPRGTRLVTNMGAANSIAAAEETVRIARACGRPCRVAVVTGDDVTAAVRARPDLIDLETGQPIAALLPDLVAANAYLGAEAVRDAVLTGADVVITGRVADPSLFLGPIMAHFGWDAADWARLGAGTAVGHLLECAGQVTGGYFADPGVKDVPDLDRLGFPLAEVAADGTAVLTKIPGTGGRIDRETVIEQLLYEVHDPSAYVTPDVVADVSGVRLRQAGPDRVEVAGATGRARTGTLKVSVSYHAGFMGEGHVAYAGPNALARARLAADVVEKRLARRGLPLDELRVDLIGVSALHRGAGLVGNAEPAEVRLRVAARTQDRKAAAFVGQEVQSLLTNGPAGGAGDFMQTRELIGVRSVLLPREAVTPRIEVMA